MEPRTFEPPSAFEMVLVEDDGVTHRILLRGELDVATSAGLTESLCAIAHSTLVVDLAEITFIDSSGVGALIRAKNHIDRTGNSMVLTRPSRAVRRLFEILAIDHLLDDSPPKVGGEDSGGAGSRAQPSGGRSPGAGRQ